MEANTEVELPLVGFTAGEIEIGLELAAQEGKSFKEWLLDAMLESKQRKQEEAQQEFKRAANFKRELVLVE